jgi:hypothetical protein
MDKVKPSSPNVELCLRLANNLYDQARLSGDPNAKAFLLCAAKAYETLAIMNLSLERDAVLIATSDKLLREA